MAIGIGSFVRVKPPFDEFYTGTFEIDAISETGAFQINGVDFSPEYLEEVTDGNHNP
jgi:hypothetical protein